MADSTFRYDNDRSRRDLLIAYCGFSPTLPMYAADSEHYSLDGKVEMTFRSIQGKSNESFELAVSQNHPWKLSVAPEGIRAIGSGAGTAVRGGPWHSTPPHLVITGWGYVHHAVTGEHVQGECILFTPPYEPGVEPESVQGYAFQIRPVSGGSPVAVAALEAAQEVA